MKRKSAGVFCKAGSEHTTTEDEGAILVDVEKPDSSQLP